MTRVTITDSHEALGPHGGHLLELGQEQYHAEWTFSTTKTLPNRSRFTF
ncbi:MAG: hypothetical protein R3C99_06875 [Pirellulaceae bacterium]